MQTCYERDYLNLPAYGTYAQGGESAVGHRRSGKTYRLFKRTFDFLGALAVLIVGSPFFAIIYLAILLYDGHNPIYSQERIGLNGRPFNIYKFRSMRPDAESKGEPQLCDGRNDNRLTPIGRFLRSHHLDEIPQLWNVIVGDMSFVGYRPERKYFINQIRAMAPEYDRLYAMRPGIFSYATLYNGYTDTMAKMLVRLRLDLEYMGKASLWYDTKIILLTVTSIVTGKEF